MGLQEDFDAAAENAKNLNGTPSNDDLLELYAFFKQANFGDNTTPKPGMLDFKGKAKWEAWNGKQGVSKDESMTKYIEKVASLIATHGLK